MTNEEIILGAWVAGKRRITCPVCSGGDSREEDTMALYVGSSSGELFGRCYRAACDGIIMSRKQAAAFDNARPAFEPRPLRAPYRLATAKDYWGKQWLDRSYESEFYQDMSKAASRGLRVLVENPDTCVWRLRALDYKHLGHITRTKDKKISTYKDVDRPLYYYNGLHNAGYPLFVFEDAMSAALCGRGAVALLGTSVSAGLADDLRKADVAAVRVCLDPGAEEAAEKAYNKLVAAGIPATFVPMSKDYKDMTLEERKNLEETYA